LGIDRKYLKLKLNFELFLRNSAKNITLYPCLSLSYCMSELSLTERHLRVLKIVRIEYSYKDDNRVVFLK
jgi:hypothetical protein